MNFWRRASPTSAWISAPARWLPTWALILSSMMIPYSSLNGWRTGRRYRPWVYTQEGEWYQKHIALIKKCRELVGEDFPACIPDLMENVDVLASLRGVQGLNRCCFADYGLTLEIIAHHGKGGRFSLDEDRGDIQIKENKDHNSGDYGNQHMRKKELGFDI